MNESARAVLQGTKVFFSDIHIIESLRGKHAARTGTRLFERIHPKGLQLQRPIAVHHHWAETSQDLMHCFELAADDLHRRGRAPLFHIEAHGGTEGIELANGEFVTWQNLRPALTQINILTGLNLCVVVAACVGLDAAKLLDGAERAPARLVLGPIRDCTEREIEVGFDAFYDTLFETLDGVRAIAEMNRRAAEVKPEWAEPGDLFHGLSAERMFFSIWRGYFETLCTPQAIDERIDRILPTWVLPPGMEAVARSQIRALLTDYRAFFEAYRHRFFFMDLQPENAARFPIPFDACMAGLNPA